MVIPAALPDIYRDLRAIGLGMDLFNCFRVDWYDFRLHGLLPNRHAIKNFDNVYAAILIIGVIGLVCDWGLMKLGERMFTWKVGAK